MMDKEELITLLKLAGYVPASPYHIAWQHPIGPTVTNIRSDGVRMVGYPHFLTYDECWETIKEYFGRTDETPDDEA